MKSIVLAATLVLAALTAGCAGTRVYGGGYYASGPPPPPAGYYDRGPSPGLGFVWIDGYYVPSGGRYAWRQGYWTRPPHRGAVWVAPRWERGHYHEGRWRR
ncbi:MAG TPA: hypothetical protein VNH18_10800 [Bryobacteraceae bacterium]|nr:hypothetical protein [Bryobacteraceae bacterium]